MKKVNARVWSCVMAAGMLAAAVTGCSGGSSSAGSSASSGGEASSSAEAGSAAGSSAADGEVRKIVVGTGNGAAPFCYLDEDGNPVGYDLDVLHELDERLPQYEFDIQSMDFSTLVVSIDSGSVNMLSHQLVKSDARKEKYLFPKQYYCLSPMSLAVRTDSDITSLLDMKGKSMELNPSQYEYQMVLAWNEAHPGNEVNLIGISDQSTADNYMKVSNGQTDASLTYKATFDSVTKDIGVENLKLTDVVLCEDTYIMFPKTEQQLCDDVDAVLTEMMEDGTLSEISTKWYGEDVFGLYKDMIAIVAD